MWAKPIKGRFTLSYHFFGKKHPKNHLDLFLLTEGQPTQNLEIKNLHTLEVPLDFYQKRQTVQAKVKPKHRLVYLNFQGKIKSGGQIKILKQ